MHNKSYAARSLVLLAVLVSTAIFMRGLVDAAPPFTVSIESDTGQTSYLLGEQVRLSGEAEFLSSDLATALVTLVIGGPQEVTQVLSVSDGVFSYPANNLEVTVTSVVITESSGTLPGGTLPSGTLCDCVRLLYDIVWSPPIFIDPAPEFVLVPQLSQVFGIPIVTPTAVAGEAGLNTLPDTTQKFAIPLVGTPESGQPSALPGGESAFAVPIIPTPTPDPSAPDPLPSLTTAFSVPAVPTATSEAGAPSNLPTITEAFSIPVAATPTAESGAVTALPTLSTVFNIPTAPTPAAVSGVAELPNTTEVFSIPNGKSPLGITSDGTDFYILVNGTPDEIYKVNATGTLVTAFGGDGIVDVTFNGDTRGSAEGIAYVGGNLYVADSEWRHETGDGYSLLKFDSTDGAEADITAGDNSCAIPDFRRFSGLHADGTRLWGVEDYNSNLVKITTDCTQVTNLSVWGNSSQALAVGSGDHPFFFVSEGEKIIKRSKDDGSDTNVSFTLTNAIVKGLLYQGGLLYIADADSKKVLKANIPHGQTITTDPRGIAYDGQYLYILVDASPKDKIIVVDPSDTSTTPAIVRSFDAPSSKADSLTFADGFLWLGQEQGCCDREIKKLDRQAGNVAATLTLSSPIHQAVGGLGHDGTNLVGFLKQFENSFFTISKTNGDSTQVNVDFDSGADGYQAGTFRDTTDRAYAAKDNVIYEFTDDGEERQAISLSPSSTDVKGMTFIGANLYIADDDTNTIYRGSIGHGVTITTNPLALAANGTSTLYLLLDGTPNDVILTIDASTTTSTNQFDAPDDKGEGLTYLNGSLYYASNKDGDRKIFQLNASTGAQVSSFEPQNQQGSSIWDNLLGLGNDGTSLFVSDASSWENCLDKVNSSTGDNQSQICAEWQEGLMAARGVAVAPDGFVLIAKNDELVQLDPDGQETNHWAALTGATDIEGLAFAGSTLYIADNDNDKIYKTTVPSGINITTDPRAMAYGTANNTTTLFVLVNATPVDKILLVDPDTGALAGSYDAPDDKGQGLTYLNGSLYYASNKDFQRTIYRLNPDTGAQQSSFNPQGQFGELFDNIQGLGNDGTDLIIAQGNPFESCLIKVNTTFGDFVERLCADFNEGITQANGVTVAPDGFILAARNDDIVQLFDDGNELNSWVVTSFATDIQGLTFVSSTLYVADDDSNTVLKTTVPSGIQVTTDPRGLAVRTIGSGTSTTSTLFVLVNATPVDKVLLVDPDTGTLMDSFDTPDRNGGGITFLDGSLYYAGREEGEGGGGRTRVYELDPDTGSVLNSMFVSESFGDAWEEPQALGNDGTDLLVVLRFRDCALKIDRNNGDFQGELCPRGDGFSFSSGDFGHGLVSAGGGSLWSVLDEVVTEYIIEGGSELVEVASYTSDFDGNNSPDARDFEGVSLLGETLYMADDDDNTIYKASKPSGITTNPQGMTYDGTLLYILVDGSRMDHVVVVDPATGAVVRDFEAPTRDSIGITHMDTQTTSTLFISSAQNEFGNFRKQLHRISPVDGSEVGETVQIFQDDWVDGWRGLTNDGTSLILVPDREGFAILLDPDTLGSDGRIDFYNSPFSGFDAIAYHATAADLLATDGGTVSQIDEDGRFLQGFDTPLGQINGAAVIGNVLYLTEAVNDTIQAAVIPRPPTQVSATPKGMASDGTRLYLVVEGNPKDRILVLGTDGTVFGSFDAPAENTNGLAWHGGNLYAVTNEFHPQFGELPARIYALNAGSGQVLQSWDIAAPWGGPLFDAINGLTSDGTYIYAGRRDSPEWFRIDPASPGTPALHVGAFGEFDYTFYVGSLEIAAAADIETSLLASGFSDQGPVITRYDLDGLATEQFNLGQASIEGMAYIGTVLYMADAAAGNIVATTLRNNIPEETNIGAYTIALGVKSNGTSADSEPTVDFSVVRNTDVRTEITEPLQDFATTTTVIPIQGRINDPSIQNVTVGVVLPFTTILEDDVPDGSASLALWDANGLWHPDCNDWWGETPVNASDPCRWRFGVPDQPEFGQGVREQGTLTTKAPISVGPGTRLSFSTWYATEPVPDVDLKLVEVAPVTYDQDGNPVVGNYEALVQIVGFGFFGAPVPSDESGQPRFSPHTSFEHREVEQFWLEFVGGQAVPRFDVQEVSLQPFVGQDVMVRFRFDTVDGIGNSELGWFIDDIAIEGSGFKGQQTAVTPIDPPITEDGVKWFSTFATTFELAEGPNEVVAVGVLPYSPKPNGPKLHGVAKIDGFLDLTGPEVDLGGIPDVVGNPLQTLLGTIDDINLLTMEITHEYLAGSATTSKTVFTLTQLPVDGQFSTPVSLLEGTNTFKATAIDGSGNQSLSTFAVVLDTVGPTLTPLATSYPTGSVSARAGDLVVFNVNAIDNRPEGIDRVEVRLPDGEIVTMANSGDIPQAVLSQWQATGDFVFPADIPSNTPPGEFVMEVTAYDLAGNSSVGTVTATVVATLKGFSFSLMPGQNLVSLPLKPDASYDGETGNIANLFGTELLAKIDTIMYYDGSPASAGLPQEDRWSMFKPDAVEASDLFTMETGRGYWIRMKDDSGVFEFDDPLAPGLPATPRPIVWSYTGEFLEPGTVPPSYELGAGWNLVGFHSEHELPVTTALQSLESPNRTWASLYQYDNVIRFTLGDDENEGSTEIILGGFRRVLPTGNMAPGLGFWLFMVSEGVLAP